MGGEMKTYYPTEMKLEHVEAFLDSGLNLQQYTALHKIPRTTLQRWVLGDGINGRSSHPKRQAFFQFLKEGLTAYKAGVALGIHRGTYQYWIKNNDYVVIVNPVNESGLCPG
jgi:hypothetical protein